MLKKSSTLLNFKPDPIRQTILVGLAFVGIGIGYGAGYLLKENPLSKPSEIQEHKKLDTNTPPKIARARRDSIDETIFPESHVSNDKHRTYEKTIPKDIVGYIAKRNPQTIKFKPKPTPQSSRLYKKSETTILIPTEDQLFRFENTSMSQTPIVEEVAKKIPRWLKNALPVILSNKPKIAIVLDDMGIDQQRSYLATQLKGPLTLSYLTYARDLSKQTNQARQAGHELMLHVPMEPANPNIDPGPNVLLSGVSKNETIATLNWGLNQFSSFVGINNHMGSRFTSDLEGMRTVMQELKKRELIFLDSVTSGSTKGQIAANQIGVPFIARNIFLDHIDDINEIKARLNAVKKLAKTQGYAVAIGHPRDSTIKALKPWLAQIENENFQLVPISALIPMASMQKSHKKIQQNEKHSINDY